MALASQADPRELCAVTFTRKATGELRERVWERLTEAAEALAPVLREYGLVLDAAEVPRVVTARVLHLPATAGGLAIKVFPADQPAEAHTEASLLAYLVDREREREREGRGGAGYRVQQLRRTVTHDPLLVLDEDRKSVV